MNKKIRKTMFIAFLLFNFGSFCNIFSQDCPPNYLGWNPQTAYMKPYIGPLGGPTYGSVNFRSHQNPDGTYDAKIDWSTLINGTNYNWRLTNEELKGIGYLAVISNIISGCNSGNILTISFYETVQCQLTRHCYLYADKTTKILCKDNLWPGPDPNTLIGTDYEVWLILWNQQCGTKCCKKTFTVRCGSGNASGSNNYTFLNVVSTDFIPCQTSDKTDCLFGTPEQCTGTCP